MIIKDKRTFNIEILVKDFFMEYSYCYISYELNGYIRNISIRLPISNLMLCLPLEDDIERFKEEYFKIRDKKSSVIFNFDWQYVRSLNQLKSAISFKGSVRIYQVLDKVKGRIHGSTQYNDTIGLIQIDVIPPQCSIIVCSSNKRFRDIVINNLMNVLC